MVEHPQQQKISVEEYLKLDQTSEIRYEYIDGYAYALAGGTAAHSLLAVNMIHLLNEQLQSGPCRVFNSDMRVQLSRRRYVYPDVVVSCDVADSEGLNEILRSPHLIVEILSPTTELYDRVQKFSYYQELPSMQEYMLISTQRQMVEIYRRNGATWTYRRYYPGQTVELESLDIHIPFTAIYERVRVPIDDDEFLEE
ncbi:MAG TPA: Uma2 family endonuclease [Ktedonobacteraceae bacterium]|nr:Uma2 family endonuclease [Ktedonobacteraceae bacterium]